MRANKTQFFFPKEQHFAIAVGESRRKRFGNRERERERERERRKKNKTENKKENGARPSRSIQPKKSKENWFAGRLAKKTGSMGQVGSEFTQFSRVLLGFIRFYLVLPGFPSFNSYYWRLPSFTGFLLDFTGFYLL